MPKTVKRATLFLFLGLTIALLAGWEFSRLWRVEPLFPASTLKEIKKLSDYHRPLKGTAGDTDLYLFDSGLPGATLLVCGGTHPNEPAGFLSAVVLLENINVGQGRVIIIPRANAPGFTHNDSQEAMLQHYEIETPFGPRRFRNGSRFTNPVKQWPDPSVYITPAGGYWEEQKRKYPTEKYPTMQNNPGPQGQNLSGVDSRNLNRTFPGDPKGNLTEQIAHAIVTLIRKEKVDLAIDFHEASPEYPTINVIIAHQRAESIAAMAELYLSDDAIQISTDSSSLQLRGLSHREWGDATDCLAFLLESACPSQGRLKGRTTKEQLILGKDAAYYRVSLIEKQLNRRLAERAKELKEAGKQVTERRRKILHIDYPEEGIPLEVRVGRHVQATKWIIESFNNEYPDRNILVENIPSYVGLQEKGLGAFLRGPNGEVQ